MLSEEVIALLRSLGGGMLCTRSAQQQAALHECLLAQIEPTHFIGIVPDHLARSLRENVAEGGQAAFVTSRVPGDHRSVQLKGTITELREPQAYPEEVRAAFPALRRLFPDVTDAQADGMLALMVKRPSFWLRFEVLRVFDQSPGPSAGRPIAGEGA